MAVRRVATSRGTPEHQRHQACAHSRHRLGRCARKERRARRLDQLDPCCAGHCVESWATARGVPAARLRLAGPFQESPGDSSPRCRWLRPPESHLSTRVRSLPPHHSQSSSSCTNRSSLQSAPCVNARADGAADAGGQLVSRHGTSGRAAGAEAATSPTTTTYTVQRRDSLWKIAECQLGDPLRWRELWELNRGRDFGGSPSAIRTSSTPAGCSICPRRSRPNRLRPRRHPPNRISLRRHRCPLGAHRSGARPHVARPSGSEANPTGSATTQRRRDRPARQWQQLISEEFPRHPSRRPATPRSRSPCERRCSQGASSSPARSSLC